MTDERETLSKERALQMLPDKQSIHTFRGGMMIIGCDCSRESIVEAIESHDVELSGETATRMGHAMCLKDDQGWLFIETVATPNDPKLSDGGAWRGACPTVARRKDAQM